MLVLGIDPGTARCGWGVVEKRGNVLNAVEYGIIETSKDMPQSVRLKTVYEKIFQIIKKFDPEVMAVEKIFFNRNVTNALSVGEARGVILLAGEKAGIEITEYTPLQVKMALTGYGKAEKKQVESMVMRILNLKSVPKPDDTADALAVALCCAASYKMQTIGKNGGGKV